MKEFGNIEAFVAHLGTLVTAEVAGARHALSKCAKLVEKRAKDKIGEYQEQSGPFIAWAELADSTKADRVRHGYAEDEPLLRTGDMRDSIGHALSLDTLEAQVGSNSDIAVYQELGTARIPPRSFLGGAMSDELPKIKKIIGETMFGVLIGKTPAAALVGDEVVEGGIAIGQ